MSAKSPGPRKKVTPRRKDIKTQSKKKEEDVTENEIASTVVDSAIEVHRCLGGPGLLESVYEEALVYELEHRGLTVQR